MTQLRSSHHTIYSVEGAKTTLLKEIGRVVAQNTRNMPPPPHTMKLKEIGMYLHLLQSRGSEKQSIVKSPHYYRDLPSANIPESQSFNLIFNKIKDYQRPSHAHVFCVVANYKGSGNGHLQNYNYKTHFFPLKNV